MRHCCAFGVLLFSVFLGRLGSCQSDANALQQRVFRVSYGSGETCLQISAKIQLDIKYKLENNNMSDWVTLNVSAGAAVNRERSSCAPQGLPKYSYEQLTVSLMAGAGNLSFWFTNDTLITSQADGRQFSLYKITFYANLAVAGVKTFPDYNPKDFSFFEEKGANGTDGLFTAVPVRSSLFCKSTTQLQISDTLRIKIRNVRLEAFQRTNDSDFRTPSMTCQGDKSVVRRKPDLVPVIVGGCLAAMILIIILAYLICNSSRSANKKPGSPSDIAENETHGNNAAANEKSEKF